MVRRDSETGPVNLAPLEVRPLQWSQVQVAQGGIQWPGQIRYTVTAFSALGLCGLGTLCALGDGAGNIECATARRLPLPLRLSSAILLRKVLDSAPPPASALEHLNVSALVAEWVCDPAWNSSWQQQEAALIATHVVVARDSLHSRRRTHKDVDRRVKKLKDVVYLWSSNPHVREISLCALPVRLRLFC